MIKAFGIILIVFSLGCASGKFSFAPIYNAQIVQQVQAGMNETDSLYSVIIASSNKNFELYALDYLRIENEINAISLADSLRPKAVKIKFIADNLKVHFVRYELDHKTRHVLSAGELKAYKADLKAFWKPLLVAEQSLNQ